MQNNGADGLAAARQLNEDGIDVHVVFAGTSEGTDEYRLQKSIVGNLGIDCVEYDGNIDFSEYDYIIDAIFGIGLSRAVEGRYAQVIEAINKARVKHDTCLIISKCDCVICFDSNSHNLSIICTYA